MKIAVRASLLGLFAAGGLQVAAHAADLPSTKSPPTMPPPPSFFLFEDTTVSYRHEFSATDPGSAVKFPKEIAGLTHVDAYAYGTNFFNIDFLQSNGFDPMAPALQAATAPYTNYGAGGASMELYALYRGTLSGNALSHSKMFSFGFLKDISLSFGGDGESQNTAFAPHKRDLVGGIQFSFDVPGYLTLAVHAYKEWNHNGLTQVGGPLAFLSPGPTSYFNPFNGGVSFRVTPEFEATYAQPLTFTGLPLTFSGFTNVVMPKGKDGFGNNTRTEILTSERLTLDIGQLTFGKPHVLDWFVGYKFWWDKFGNNATFGQASFTQGSYENQVYTGIALHVF